MGQAVALVRQTVASLLEGHPRPRMRAGEVARPVAPRFLACLQGKLFAVLDDCDFLLLLTSRTLTFLPAIFFGIGARLRLRVRLCLITCIVPFVCSSHRQ